MKLKAFLKMRGTHTYPRTKNIPLGASGFYITRAVPDAGYSGAPLAKRGRDAAISLELLIMDFSDC
jgi:hypothetical protein